MSRFQMEIFKVRGFVVFRVVIAVAVICCFWSTEATAQGKRLPPPGIEVDASVRSELAGHVRDLQGKIRQASQASTDAEQWVPDVEVLVRAVRLALEQDLFFKKSEPKIAAGLLELAEKRLQLAASGKRGLELLGFTEDVSEPQLLVGGFRSRIDDSVQPFGLVVPPALPLSSATRVDVWLHGRGDTKTEIPFLNERRTKVGQYAPDNAIVLHPFGRHCNAFKFAGETDVYEALEHLGQLVKVDESRVSIRGFSMGGAGCWHLAVHDPTRWFAANPGAGFVDTIVYQGWQQETPFPIDPTKQRLLHLYDVLPWVRNLKNTRTIAYSGEVDKQRQAADRVMDVATDYGVDIDYVIGKEMGHKINKESAEKVQATLDTWSKEVSNEPRREVDFTTYTLRFNQAGWVSITGMEEHWSPSRVRGKLVGDNEVYLTTDGVNRLALDFRRSGWPKTAHAKLTIDGQSIALSDWDEAPGIQCELQKSGEWSVVEVIEPELRKKPGLQGPIDDAFYDRFVFVVPSRPAKHGVVQRWIDREIKYATDRWARLMRGDVRIVEDTAVTEEHIKNCHLVCFGDLTSNQYLRGIAPHLPVKWTRDELKVGSKVFNPSEHAAAFCFPNPRNPKRYLVVNSGMTFREFSNVSNSRQIAMLPDWAIMDVSDQSNDNISAGKIVVDGFFDENWKLKE